MAVESAAVRHITIDPITRLEGHGKIDIFLDDAGQVERAYFQVPELRGFEKFAQGRLVEDMPQITSRICGVCPTAHHMASTKALDAVYQVEPTATAKKIRELVYSTFMVEDHALHFYFLGGPDFVVGPTAPAAERNILGVIGKVGVETGKKVIAMRRKLRSLMALAAGKPGHPVLGLPGGVARAHHQGRTASVPGGGRRSRRVRPVHAGRFRQDRSEELGLREPDPLRPLHPSHALHGDGGREQPRELLRWPAARGVAGRQGSGEVRPGQVPRLHRRARRAVVAT